MKSGLDRSTCPSAQWVPKCPSAQETQSSKANEPRGLRAEKGALPWTEVNWEKTERQLLLRIFLFCRRGRRRKKICTKWLWCHLVARVPLQPSHHGFPLPPYPVFELTRARTRLTLSLVNVEPPGSGKSWSYFIWPIYIELFTGQGYRW